MTKYRPNIIFLIEHALLRTVFQINAWTNFDQGATAERSLVGDSHSVRIVWIGTGSCRSNDYASLDSAVPFASPIAISHTSPIEAALDVTMPNACSPIKLPTTNPLPKTIKQQRFVRAPHGGDTFTAAMVATVFARFDRQRVDADDTREMPTSSGVCADGKSTSGHVR